ncbi:PREDICTED: uncharacterized protein LOC109338439 [Lupinus angustifolius]|uniref:uncharacterized protein LOC109338438 n=1 Tax=Lupinus angustifolius TaxID=3871 RepID=UPI00092EF6F6|nr:PREDICTED: uncharacterized protein LOC109338438 [Lupinus angustifolius]XP_019431221.1 PREDICTED: uncharacterized protein LOC109338439 [Lupinus angustifolius]
MKAKYEELTLEGKEVWSQSTPNLEEKEVKKVNPGILTHHLLQHKMSPLWLLSWSKVMLDIMHLKQGAMCKNKRLSHVTEAFGKCTKASIMTLKQTLTSVEDLLMALMPGLRGLGQTTRW